MWLTILEFAGVTLGIKLLLGLALIYYLLPADGQCPACDGDTLPLQARRGLRALGRGCGMERRWCLSCGETMTCRRKRGGSPAAGPADPVEQRKAA